MSPLCRKFCPFIQVIKYEPEDFISMIKKKRFHLVIHKYYCKYVSIHTYLSHYILCVSFGSLLSPIVHLLPQINVYKNMRIALICVVCALPVFIIVIRFTHVTYGNTQ